MPPARAWTDEYTLLCERCGYVVEGLPREGACPECGKAIAESLPERRVGTAWQNDASWLSAAQTWATVLGAPFRTLDRTRFERRSRGLRLRAVGLSSVLTGVFVFEIGWSQRLLMHPYHSGSFVGSWINLLATALVATVLSFGMLLLLTWIEQFGLVFLGRRRGVRISKEIAGTICDLGCVGWIIAAGGAALGGGVGVLASSLSDLERGGAQDMASSLLTFVGMVLAAVSVLAGFLVFETFAWLGLRRCKFANRARPKGAPSAGAGPA